MVNVIAFSEMCFPGQIFVTIYVVTKQHNVCITIIKRNA